MHIVDVAYMHEDIMDFLIGGHFRFDHIVNLVLEPKLTDNNITHPHPKTILAIDKTTLPSSSTKIIGDQVF